MVINEIMYDAEGSDVGHEWIEIYNNKSFNIDLSGWKFYEAETEHRLSLIQGNWILTPGDYAIISDQANQFLIDHPNFGKTVLDSSFSLNNSSEDIIIKDGRGNIIDEVLYSNSWGGRGNKKTIEKKNNGEWEESQREGGSPGEQNSPPLILNEQEQTEGQNHESGSTEDENQNQPSLEPEPIFNAGDVVINEFVFDPIEGNEWIELYNTTNQAIDFKNWTIEDNTERPISLNGLTIVAKSWLILYQGQDFSFYLNNSGDIIKLKYQETVIDQVTYGDFDDGNIDDNALKGSKGNSLARKINGQDSNQDNIDFSYTHTPTPGRGNIISLSPVSETEPEEPEENISVIDTTKPVISFISKPDNPTNQKTAVFEFQADEVVNFFCKLNIDDWEICNSPKIYNDLVQGEQKFYLKALDQANNESLVDYVWNIDLSSPVASIAMSGKFFNQESWPVVVNGNVSLTDNLEKIEIQFQKGLNSYYLDQNLVWQENRSDLWISQGVNLNKMNKTWSYNLPKNLLEEDDYYFIRSRAISSLGNIQTEPAVFNFIFDNTPPSEITQALIETNGDDQKDLKLLWNDINDNLSGLDYYEINWSEGNVTSSKSEFNFRSKNRTNYVFKIRAKDKAGNWSDFSKDVSHTVDVPSLVISEIQVSGKREFIELYNPTEENIFLNNWYLAYYSQNQNWGDTPHRLKKFPDSGIIKSKGYYLIGVYGLSEAQADWVLKTDAGQSYSSGQLSDVAGSIVIYSDNPLNIDKNDLQKEYIDAVGWGDVSYIKENTSVGKPNNNESLERKNGGDKDTDNNVEDFSFQPNPTPQSARGLWLNGWSERKLAVIDNRNNANNLIDYQIKIKVDYEQGMNSDFSDVRFTSQDGKTVLSYFLETYILNQSADFWVKAPSIPAYSEILIYLYYGNEDAIYDGNPQNVFIWFDDFSTNRLAEYNYLNAGWDGQGHINIYNWDFLGRNVYGYLNPKISNEVDLKNVYIKAKMRLIANDRCARNSRQAFIEYRRSGDNYFAFGLNNQASYDYGGLHFDENSGEERYYIKYVWHEAYNQWGVYEVRAYETNHWVHYQDDNFEQTWSFTTSYLNQNGDIYLKGGEIESSTAVMFDYLIIAQQTQPEPEVSFKNENYEISPINPRDTYSEFPNWDGRKTILIENETNTTSTDPLIDYAVKIEVNYLEGMNPDFSDVRFTDSDKRTILDYWNESYIRSQSAAFWVKIPQIPANGNKNIYLYYNNPSATYLGDGKNVFIWFDDFSTNRLAEYNYLNAGWDGQGHINIYNWDFLGRNVYGYLNPKISNEVDLKNVYIKAKMRLIANDRCARNSRQAFIEYRRSGDNYFAFGLNNQESYDYGGLHFDENSGEERYYIGHVRHEAYNQWGVYEVRAYETNHWVHYQDDNFEQTWSFTTSYLNQNGDIYLKGGEIESSTAVMFDYLIVAKYKEPEIEVSFSD